MQIIFCVKNYKTVSGVVGGTGLFFNVDENIENQVSHCCLNLEYRLCLHLEPVTKNLKKEDFMQYSQGHFAKAYNKKYKKTGHFWTGRYHSTIIESEEHYMNCLFYIELNMTRNGVTKHPKEWRYSSYGQHAYGKGIFKIDYHDQYLQLGSSPKQRQKKYRQIMQSAMEEKGLLKKQQPLTYGIIYGSKQFVQNIIQKHANHKYYEKRKNYKTQEKEIYTLRKTNIDTS
ncbi:hypothetical protein [Candidatus Uabimicrobium sp. HlEnr_7]|uniref:hypothetical protein n=1 Tax=Candidatus Uabimicrobium helgolandensis TaxID=3095367 RepID=UPI003557C766